MYVIQTPEFGTADARSEAQQNMAALKEELRQLEVVTTKANARLDALREAGSECGLGCVCDSHALLLQLMLTSGYSKLVLPLLLIILLESASSHKQFLLLTCWEMRRVSLHSHTTRFMNLSATAHTKSTCLHSG